MRGRVRKRRLRGMRGGENVTGKGDHVLSWKTKRRDRDRRLAPWQRGTGKERKEREKERGTTKRENTSSGEEPEYNAGDAGSASRHLTTKKKDPHAIYWPESREFMRRFALAGGSTRDEKPKFLSNPHLPSMLLPYFTSLSLSLCFYMWLGWIARNCRNERDILLNAINIKCATRAHLISRLLSTKFISSSGYRIEKNCLKNFKTHVFSWIFMYHGLITYNPNKRIVSLFLQKSNYTITLPKYNRVLHF